MIIVVSHPADAHGNNVVARLVQQGADVVVFDTSAFPRDVRLTVAQPDAGLWQATARIDGQVRDLTEARVVWWRRPLPFRVHDDLTGQEDRAFAYGESHAAITGLWSSLDAHWVNDPERDQVASRKMAQLKRASSLGLRVPRTCITNDPGAATAFVERERPDHVVYKSFSATEQSWRETRVLRADEAALLANVQYAPVIFQEFIPASVDVRVTIIGDHVFPAAIRSQETRYPHDFRMDLESAKIEPHQLPAEVTAGLQTLMASFGLVYGAMDLRLTPDGDYVFLEVNPSGQWLFVELRTGQPITATMAGYLSAHDRKR